MYLRPLISCFPHLPYPRITPAAPFEIMQENIAEPQTKKLKEDTGTPITCEVENGTNQEAKTVGPGETPPNPLSKNQLKKQQKLAQYKNLQKERRARERERQKQKRQEALAQGLPIRTGPSRKELKRKQSDADKQPGALRVAIDLNYDDLMHERDVAKCVKQCLRIYTINRRSQCPGQLYFTGIKTDGRIHAGFKRNDGWENWHVQYHFDQTHTDVFPRDQLVYLTSESDSTLERLEEGCVYVIGGLVDHNHQKGLCHKRAMEKGLRTARLPLSEHVDMKTRAVLSTFHVFEILVRLAEGKPWSAAILETIPMRKGAKPKQSATNMQPTNEKQIEMTNSSTTMISEAEDKAES